jgi:serine/threonine-protein kinase
MSDRDNPQPEPPGRRYKVLAVLAHGGMGVVYRATDTAIGCEVVVKVLHDRFAPESAVARQFVDGARIMGQLQHPGIPPVHDIGALQDGRPFFVMKLIRGRTLQDVLDEGADPVTERGRLLAVFEQVCQTVAYAHYRGVAHRDLKPAHVMIGEFGEVQVVGWGAARVFGGSPPEQADGVPADGRSDVFSLGGILCTILTGRSGATERLDGCGAGAGLVALARQCLSPNPGDRPPDACAVSVRIAELRRGIG